MVHSAMPNQYVVTVESRVVVDDPETLIAAAIAAGAQIPADFPAEGRIRMALESLTLPPRGAPGTSQPTHSWTTKVTARQEPHVG
jgi:hypothetical protein